ncbi:LLM class flavin-dependent oxidoreductase [Peribacillus sp. NPDC076916]|uniref:LLM class flavin-dependent oxidoreductase n=1 Tax=Peribacillus sp. NPDC076916 TaxID=3390608 RepID=UPI003D083027
MAQYVEELGYERYWFAEHHATRGLGSSSPEIMMAAVAAKTAKLKVSVVESCFHSIVHIRWLPSYFNYNHFFPEE